MKEYRIVIGGCRYFNDYVIFKQFVNQCLETIGKKKITILSGH